MLGPSQGQILTLKILSPFKNVEQKKVTNQSIFIHLNAMANYGSKLLYAGKEGNNYSVLLE